MFERIITIMRKEFILILRDPRMRGIIFVAPVVQLLLFGYAANMDIKNIPAAVYDLDNTPQSRELARKFSDSGYFRVLYRIGDDRAQRSLLDRGRVNAVIRFNRGFAQDLLAKRPAKLQLLIDGTDSNTASVILSYSNNIVSVYSSKILAERFVSSGAKPPAEVDLRQRAWFNENLVSCLYYIPGVILLLITVTTLLLTAMAIVREKESGTIEQLMVSPIRPQELILGKLLPFGIIGVIDVFLITVIGVLLFQLPVRGSLFLLFGATLAYLLTSLGIGLFISTISATQQEAMLSTFLFLFPANMLSGFMFPIQNMPQLIQYATYLNPLRYFMEILRGIFLKGVGLDILWPNMLILTVMGMMILGMSSLRFRKRLG